MNLAIPQYLEWRQMLATSAEKVNDPVETPVDPGTFGLKLVISRGSRKAVFGADTPELTSWKITSNVANFDFDEIEMGWLAGWYQV